MASEGTKFKLEMAAGIVKDYSSRWASADQDIILDDILEILRRCHTIPKSFDADELSEIIADYCIAAYGPPLYDFSKAQKDAVRQPQGTPSETPSQTPSSSGHMPPELDIPDQH